MWTVSQLSIFPCSDEITSSRWALFLVVVQYTETTFSLIASVTFYKLLAMFTVATVLMIIKK